MTRPAAPRLAAAARVVVGVCLLAALVAAAALDELADRLLGEGRP